MSEYFVLFTQTNRNILNPPKMSGTGDKVETAKDFWQKKFGLRRSCSFSEVSETKVNDCLYYGGVTQSNGF